MMCAVKQSVLDSQFRDLELFISWLRYVTQSTKATKPLFPLDTFPPTPRFRSSTTGAFYEEWDKAAPVDLRTGSRTQVAGAQENAGATNRQKDEKDGRRNSAKAFSIGLSLDSRV
jgi:hypothetical protein